MPVVPIYSYGTQVEINSSPSPPPRSSRGPTVTRTERSPIHFIYASQKDLGLLLSPPLPPSVIRLTGFT